MVKKRIFIISIFIFLIILATALCIPPTLAIWTNSGGESNTVVSFETQVDDAWGKYFLYHKIKDTTNYEIIGLQKLYNDTEMVIPSKVPIGASIFVDTNEGENGAIIQSHIETNNVDNLAVTKICSSINDKFDVKSIITKLVIPSSITNIDPNTFAFYYNLKELVINNAAITIGDYAFANTINLETVTGYTPVGGSNIFYGSKWTSPSP